MNNYTEDMHQTSTYWPPTGQVEFGNVVLGDPEIVMCRWQGRAVSFVSPSGEARVSRAVIYTERGLLVGGVIALGDWTAHVGSPHEIAEAQTVAQVGSSPSLGADEVLHKVWI